MWWVFAVGNWIFLWPWQTCWLTVYIGRQLSNALEYNKSLTWVASRTGGPGIFRRCLRQGHPISKQPVLLVLPLPFTRAIQQKQKGFSFSLGSLIESWVALNPSNSEHEPLRFSEIKAWFYHRSQRQASFIGRDTREKHVGRSQLHLKVSWVKTRVIVRGQYVIW